MTTYIPFGLLSWIIKQTAVLFTAPKARLLDCIKPTPKRSRERAYSGLAAARARGGNGGRSKKLGDKQRAVAVDLYRQKKHPIAVDEIYNAVGISRPTLHKSVAAAQDR